MKKLIALVLAALMLLAMTACGQTQQGAAQGETNDTGASETGKKYVVGVCQLLPHEALDAATKGFKDTLEAEFGDNVEVVVELAGGDSNLCSTIVNSFVADEVDLIMANATPALCAAYAATEDIPILGTSITEYGVALELENFNGTVGGNVSGTSDLAPLTEQAAMILEWVPDAKNVGLLYCSAEPNSIYQVETVKKELEAKGLTATLYPFSDTNELPAVTQKAAAESDVIYIPTDNQAASAAETIDGICRPAGVPIIAGEEGICKGCGIATLSISYYNLGVATAKQAIQILKGEADIATMPIAYDEAPVKKYNKEICEELGVKIPEGYVAIG